MNLFSETQFLSAACDISIPFHATASGELALSQYRAMALMSVATL